MAREAGDYGSDEVAMADMQDGFVPPESIEPLQQHGVCRWTGTSSYPVLGVNWPLGGAVAIGLCRAHEAMVHYMTLYGDGSTLDEVTREPKPIPTAKAPARMSSDERLKRRQAKKIARAARKRGRR